MSLLIAGVPSKSTHSMILWFYDSILTSNIHAISPSAYVTTLVGVICDHSYKMEKIVTCEQCVQPSCLHADTTPKGNMPRTDLKGKKDIQKRQIATHLPILGNINFAVFTSVPTISLSFLCWKKKKKECSLSLRESRAQSDLWFTFSNTFPTYFL